MGARASKETVRTDDTPCETGHHHEIVHDLLAGVTDPAAVAALIHGSPMFDADIVFYLREHRGREYVDAVMAELRKLQQAATGGHPGHADAVAYRDQLASTVDKVHPRAPDPGAALPFDDHGGWNGLEINRNLGQHDALAATDSDGARCAFASALAAQIFLGPRATIAWLRSYVDEHAGSPAKFSRVDAARDVIAAVSRAIDARTATYGDLSWVQESLHGMVVSGDADGITDASQVIAHGREEYVADSDPASGNRGLEMSSPGETLAYAAALPAGARLMMMCVGVTDPSAAPFIHQFMIMNDGGAIYVYDPEDLGGQPHAAVASDAVLARYFPGPVFLAAHVYIQGTVTPKPSKKAKARPGA